VGRGESLNSFEQSERVRIESELVDLNGFRDRAFQSNWISDVQTPWCADTLQSQLQSIDFNSLQHAKDVCAPKSSGTKHELESLKAARMENPDRSLPGTSHLLSMKRNIDGEPVNQTVDDPVEMEILDATEVMLYVSVFKPKSKSRKDEYLIPASSTLACLRDKVECPLSGSEFKQVRNEGSFFCIENQFYLDESARRSGFAEPSVNALAHSKSCHSEFHSLLGEIHKQFMESSRWYEVPFRLARFYVFVHEEICEHLIMITDIRMLDINVDLINAEQYPRLMSRARTMWRSCDICSNGRASKVVFGDRFAPESPCFFCEPCYNLLHYNQQGLLLYDDFEVYPYSAEW